MQSIIVNNLVINIVIVVIIVNSIIILYKLQINIFTAVMITTNKIICIIPIRTIAIYSTLNACIANFLAHVNDDNSEKQAIQDDKRQCK
jgi:hypothetical protein